jgi:hypothetical protein
MKDATAGSSEKRSTLMEPPTSPGESAIEGGTSGDTQISGHVKSQRNWGGIETTGVKSRELKGSYEAVSK